MEEFTNRLIHETSPYLLQHAHNPVDWYPWGKEAFERARTEDKPILLSIGYSACHWCHVMAHESFEDEEIAKLMNANFVNIKVDREERPDLDQIYMNAVQMMTHHGGWPMTVFLTPDGIPFYGGTYFPPQDRYNMPGFPRLLISIAEAYRERPSDIGETTKSVLGELQRLSSQGGTDEPVSSELLSQAYVGVVRTYDSVNGGFGGAPKFPPAMVLEYLLRTHLRTGNNEALEIVDHTLRRMAEGGIYDHLAGGFHRYSTDAKWLVPHFEKMLYDNALLSRLYLHHYQLTQNNSSRRTAEGICDYVLREMTDPSGGFYSTQDADSEGHEGKFFVWDFSQIRSVLEEPDVSIFCAYYNVTEPGNFEGKNILNITNPVSDVAAQFGFSIAEVEHILARGRAKLFSVRDARVKPDRDDKILTAWNGLMLASFAEAGVILNRIDYSNAARKNAEFLLANLLSDGRLLRSYKNGRAKFNAYLEDYAFFVEGLLTLYETTGESRWLKESISLADLMIDQFWDNENAGFYFTGKDHEKLIVRSKDYFDNATPSGNSVAALSLLRLAIQTGNEDYRNRAIAIFSEVGASAARYPSGFGYLLGAVDFYFSTPKEIAVIAPKQEDIGAFLMEIWRKYLPNKVIAASTVADCAKENSFPLLRDRTAVDNQATAYVCENYACKMPVNSREALRRQLDSIS